MKPEIRALFRRWTDEQCKLLDEALSRFVVVEQVRIRKRKPVGSVRSGGGMERERNAEKAS